MNGRSARGLAAALMLVGCAAARMDGFEALARGAERIDLTGVPGWQDGDFRLGAAAGRVRRRSTGLTRASGALLPPGTEAGRVERRGTLFFDLSGTEAGGHLEGECRFDRTEAFLRRGGRSVSAASRPLSLDCRYRLNGREAGELVLDAAPPGVDRGAEARVGRVTWGATALALRSSHAVAGARVEAEAPVGYLAEEPGGRTVAGVELAGPAIRRLALPHDRETRAPALAALVTLALFWDPGDLD